MFTTPQPFPEGQSLTLDIIHLYDELTQFNDVCAFLCDAYAAIAAQEEEIEAGTVGAVSPPTG